MNDLLANMWLDAAVPFKCGLPFIIIIVSVFMAFCSWAVVFLFERFGDLYMSRNEKLALAAIIWVITTTTSVYDLVGDRNTDRDKRLKNDPVVQESWNEYKAAVQNLNDILERARQHAEEVRNSGDPNGHKASD